MMIIITIIIVIIVIIIIIIMIIIARNLKEATEVLICTSASIENQQCKVSL